MSCETDPFIRAQVSKYQEALFPSLDAMGMELPLTITVCEQTDRPNIFPAELTWSNGNNNANLLYDRSAIDKQVVALNEPDVRPVLERHYIMGGLLLGSLLQEIDSSDRIRVHGFYSEMTDGDRLRAKILATEDLPDETKNIVSNAVMTFSELEICRINAWRLMFGMSRFVQGIDGDEEVYLRTVARSDMIYSANTVKELEVISNGLTGRIDDDDYGFGTQNDELNHLGIAIVVPMTLQDIQHTIQTAMTKQDSGGSILEDDMIVDEASLAEGGGYIIDEEPNL